MKKICKFLNELSILVLASDELEVDFLILHLVEARFRNCGDETFRSVCVNLSWEGRVVSDLSDSVNIIKLDNIVFAVPPREVEEVLDD
jgi:hypothetical protein